MPSRYARAPWWTVMVWATWRNRISSSPGPGCGTRRAAPWAAAVHHRRVGGDEAIDVGEAEVPAHGVHHRDDGGVHQSALAETADAQLDVGSLDPDQRVQPVGLTPGEPLPQLVGVQGVGAPGVAGQVGHRRKLGGRHRCWLERQKGGRSGHGVTSRGDPDNQPRPRSPPTRPGTWTASTLNPRRWSPPRPQAAE